MFFLHCLRLCGDFAFAAFPAVLTGNEIKIINKSSGLLDQRLHLPCICRDRLYLAVKSICYVALFRLFEN